ncbi:MAG: hypothetical protein Q9214_000056 [Letrouitia sp. 1 TL-2023]
MPPVVPRGDDVVGRSAWNKSWKGEFENEERWEHVACRDDLNRRDRYGYSALAYAVVFQREVLVRLILERDYVRTDIEYPYDGTLLQTAVKKGNSTIVKLLLQRDDVEADSKDEVGRTPLSYAAHLGHENLVTLLLQRDGVEADSKDKAGRTPLSYAASQGYENLVSLLLQRDGVEVDSKDDKTGRTPLSYAAVWGHEEVVKRLLSNNAQADFKDLDGRTPLSYAAASGHEGISKRLLQYNVQPESKDSFGRTPLSHAAECGRANLVELLLQQSGVEVESRDIEGRTPLLYAITWGRHAVVRLLVQQKCPTSSHDSDRPPPFLRAIIGEHETVVELLPWRVNGKTACYTVAQKVCPLSDGQGTIEKMLYDEGGGALKIIRSKMRPNPETSGWRSQTTFVMNWELSDCMSKQYEGSVEIGHLLILVGSARKAYATKCSEYLQSNWPETWEICLAAIEETLHNKENLDVIFSQDNLSIIILRVADSPLVLQVIGSSNAILEVAQQLVFIAAMFRLSSSCLSLSNCFLESEATRIFRIGLAPLEAVPYESNMCWHPLFIGSIIVRGFPMPSRADEVGIELPYPVMLAFARILYPVEFAGGILLKGFDTMLVPTARRNSSIQWHFIQEESSNDLLASHVRGEKTDKRRPQRLPTWAIKDHVQDWVQLRSLDDILDKRMFLGFCDKVKIHLGTEEVNFRSVGYSRSSQRAGRTFEISGGTASFAFASQNLPGPTFAINFGFSRCQAAVKNFINVSYVELLHILKRTPVILYDDDYEVKKAWLVSALSAVLHMVHVWAERSPELVSMDNQKSRLPFAQVASDGGQAALDSLLANDNSMLELHAVPGAEPYRLKDLVHRIWGNMESVIEEIEKQKPSGIRFKRSRMLRGWQFMDMVQCQPLHRPVEQRIERSGEGWYPLAEDIMVLFCSGLGDVVQPETGAQICRRWWPVPPKKDYMVASLCSLNHQTNTCSSGSRALSAIIDGCYWNPKLLLNLDHDCPEAEDDQCNILQEITRQPAQSDYALGQLKKDFLSGYFREGAVILGRKSRLKHLSHALSPKLRRHPAVENVKPATSPKVNEEQNEPPENINGAPATLEKVFCRTNAQEGEPTPPTIHGLNAAHIDTDNAPGLASHGVAT